MLHLGVRGGGSLTYKYIKSKQEINQVETRNISGLYRNTLKIDFKSVANISNKKNISEKDCTYFGNLLEIYQDKYFFGWIRRNRISLHLV